MEPAAVVAITFDDGSVGRMQLFEHRQGTPAGPVIRDWTDQDIEAEVNRSVFQHRPVSWRQVTLADFPIEHAEFRAAWTDTGKGITVDMTKARECARQRLRAERAPLLAAEDLKVSKALVAEDRAAAEAAEAERQRLRDITALPAIDAAKTPEELKGISESPAPVANRARL